jgi:hypothetical protein
MKDLKERIKITTTIVDDGSASLVYGQKIIMDNQVAIMETLLELQQNMEILMIRTR